MATVLLIVGLQDCLLWLTVLSIHRLTALYPYTQMCSCKKTNAGGKVISGEVPLLASFHLWNVSLGGLEGKKLFSDKNRAQKKCSPVVSRFSFWASTFSVSLAQWVRDQGSHLPSKSMKEQIFERYLSQGQERKEFKFFQALKTTQVWNKLSLGVHTFTQIIQKFLTSHK